MPPSLKTRYKNNFPIPRSMVCRCFEEAVPLTKKRGRTASTKQWHAG